MVPMHCPCPLALALQMAVPFTTTAASLLITCLFYLDSLCALPLPPLAMAQQIYVPFTPSTASLLIPCLISVDSHYALPLPPGCGSANAWPISPLHCLSVYPLPFFSGQSLSRTLEYMDVPHNL
jgi:hypothetical protein